MLKNLWLKLLLVNILMFILQNMFVWVTPFFALDPKVVLLYPWMFFTSMFLHANFEHIFYNMFALALFGFISERTVGSKKFLIVYIISGFVAAVSSLYFYPNSVSLGASGAVYGLIGMMTVLRPKMVVYWGAPIPMIIFGGIYIIMDILGVFAPANPDNVAYMAHIVGFAVGMIFAVRWKDDVKEEHKIRKKTRRELEDEKIIDSELDRWEKENMGI